MFTTKYEFFNTKRISNSEQTAQIWRIGNVVAYQYNGEGAFFKVGIVMG
jgi:hypothetical protein